ncbi:acetyltransferase [Aureibaculum sp. 2210JD6-5]|uniref:acetyltransferase n=1 Tax=Aureibaculum sp. 2210JD6-5 TaxID=3103957 RepID=UPI002AACCB99|nr:acetyltransferase [Aureibaculum sp. 2210JD6-5]MDY7394191.1 acetyltransferase [Aureibaculum sp. 2210JD6-5]
MILYGASGHAKVVIDICQKLNINISAIWDDNEAITSILNYSVCKFDKNDAIRDKVIIAIGNNIVRKRIAENFQFRFGIIVHPEAVIDETSKINEGTVIMAGSIINSSTIIGKHCIVNTSSSIDHECILEDYVHISPNATLCGGVNVGEGTHIGAGAVIIPNISIGKWCTIGAGSVVLKDVLDGQKVVGNPAREI